MYTSIGTRQTTQKIIKHLLFIDQNIRASVSKTLTKKNMATAKRPRTLDSFFKPPPPKRSRIDAQSNDPKDDSMARSSHPTYPFSIPHLSAEMIEALNFAPEDEGKSITDKPDLDLLYYQPYIPKQTARDLFDFLRAELFFYRVQYNIKRGPTETLINTPRYTTVFGVDETARFEEDNNDNEQNSSNKTLVDATTGKPVAKTAYKVPPRPIPESLDILRRLTENATGCKFNFALVNYYASGDDSISYHSDDERFLGPLPAIASFTLGAQRDFLMKHKPTEQKDKSETTPMKLPLASGDMVLMRGKTQSCWLHSIPKRKGGEVGKGRVNITFRRAMVKGGTDNYYRYNVGDGGVYKWDEAKREMCLWEDKQ
jgi:alkylated DNA repair dioxygenase AlkB